MKGKDKKRLDILLVEKGLCESRKVAQSLIMQGKVKVENTMINKAGTQVSGDCQITIEKPPFPYVSRGGLKLEHALTVFKVPVEGRVALDIGASTGGFTHCLLLRGAGKVYAVDVGKGQLNYRLRNDPRVISLEKVNARYLNSGMVSERVDIVTVDISFISLMKVLARLREFMKDSGYLITLVKPQFEAGRKQVKKGVVKDPSIHKEVLLRILQFAGNCSLSCENMTCSPLKGPSGNMEFFALFRRSCGGSPQWMEKEVMDMVREAHERVW